MKKFLCIIIAALSVIAAMAQSNIDREINRIEGRKDVSVTYSERRTKKKHKLYRTTRVVSSQNKDYYARLVKAFEEDRPRTISAVLSNGTRSYTFEDDRCRSTYTLSGTPDAFTVVMSWRDNTVEEAGDDSSIVIFPDDNEFDGMVYDVSSEQWAEQQRRWAEQQRQWAEQKRRFNEEKSKLEHGILCSHR